MATRVVDLHGWTAERMAAENVQYVGRAMPRDNRPAIKAGSPFGNPFRVGMPAAKAVAILRGVGVVDVETDGGPLDMEDVLFAYAAWVRAQPKLMALLPSLRGRALGCWCCDWSPEQEPHGCCHAEMLAAMVEDLAEASAG
jgi:hypothetical protein